MSIRRETIAQATWAAIAGALIGAWESPWVMVGAVMAIAQFVDTQWGEGRSPRPVAKVTITHTGAGEVSAQAILDALRKFDGTGGTR